MPEFWTIDYSRKITLPPDFPVRVCKNGRLDRRFKKDLALAIAMIDKISRFVPDEVQYLGHFPFPKKIS